MSISGLGGIAAAEDESVADELALPADAASDAGPEATDTAG